MGVVKLSTAGILDYQKYSSFLAGNTAYSPIIGAYDLLETEILTGSQASVTFSNLNSTYGADYQHLQLRMVTRDDRTVAANVVRIQFNGDTGSNYSNHNLYATGSTVASGASASQTDTIVGLSSSSYASANIFGASILDILDAFETTKYTTTRSLCGVYAVGENYAWLASGSWQNTAALTSISLKPSGGVNFVSGSRFSLYGLKAA